MLEQVCPEANVRFSELDAQYGGPIPEGLAYPSYVKPVKAAFSVLARPVRHERELHEHTRFGKRELWVIRRLVEPFERVARQRLPGCGSAHRMMLEEPLRASQYNLDGYVFNGQLHVLGVVDAVMYPGTQAFMRFDLSAQRHACLLRWPSARAGVARKFLQAVGFTHGLFNMEFFHDPASDRLAVIEFNPRLASQFGDLYRRVQVSMRMPSAWRWRMGQDPATLPRAPATAGAAASFVYRTFDPSEVPAMPGPWQRARLAREFPDAMLFTYPKSGHSLARDFKWLGSHRYGILHLGGRDAHDLRRRCEAASALLGWPAPYAGEAQHAAVLNGFDPSDALAARIQPLR